MLAWNLTVLHLQFTKNTAIYVSEVMGGEGNPCKYFASFSLIRFLADNEWLRVKRWFSDCSFHKPYIYTKNKFNIFYFIAIYIEFAYYRITKSHFSFNML